MSVSINKNLSPLLAADYSVGRITQQQYNRYLATSQLDQENIVEEARLVQKHNTDLLIADINKHKKGKIILSAITILLVLIIIFMVLRKKT